MITRLYMTHAYSRALVEGIIGMDNHLLTCVKPNSTCACAINPLR